MKKVRQRILVPLDSTNARFKSAYFGIRRLAKVEREIEERKKKQAKCDNKRYPGERLHVDTKRLPLLSGQRVFDKREYRFVGIDDFSRELYAAIFTRPAQPQTNGKVERVIRTLMEMWHTRIEFTDSKHRKRELVRFIHFYNTVKPHSALTKTTQNGKKQIFTPYEWLEDYFYGSECK